MSASIRIAPNPSRPALVGLLRDANLPYEDLDQLEDAHFFGAMRAGELVGSVGVELYGSNALLRSLTVTEAARGQHLGQRLVDAVEDFARRQGIKKMCLLTTDASPYFARLHYAETARRDAPEAIRSTHQFAALCPGDATFMVKHLN